MCLKGGDLTNDTQLIKGSVFNLQRFSTGDGPGIRTVVFLKGCPLHCGWCHNPESQNRGPSLFFHSSQCIGCQACAMVCPKGCHRFEGGHSLDRAECVTCGSCAAACPAEAMELCGKEMTAAQVMEDVCKDTIFYENSGGGMTLSGGEPLAQFAFSKALLTLAKSHGLHTAIETCGYTKEDIALLHPLTDLWLYDIKLFPADAHEKYTGVSNSMILKNLHTLDRLGANIILRCPMIPEVNITDSHMDALAALANGLKHVQAIHLEPYHPLGISKARQLGKEQSYNNEAFLYADALRPFADRLADKVSVSVSII